MPAYIVPVSYVRDPDLGVAPGCHADRVIGEISIFDRRGLTLNRDTAGQSGVAECGQGVSTVRTDPPSLP